MIRSARRRKTVQARLVGDVVRVLIPASMSKADECTWVSEMVARIERQMSRDGIDLPSRASELARKYGLPTPSEIRWVDNQKAIWGSCTPIDRSIRISTRLAREPRWVLDYVLVHELAHLAVHSHGPAFWDLVYRYPRTERARGFLIARDLEPDEVPGFDPAEYEEAESFIGSPDAGSAVAAAAEGRLFLTEHPGR